MTRAEFGGEERKHTGDERETQAAKKMWRLNENKLCKGTNILLNDDIDGNKKCTV